MVDRGERTDEWTSQVPGTGGPTAAQADRASPGPVARAPAPARAAPASLPRVARGHRGARAPDPPGHAATTTSAAVRPRAVHPVARAGRAPRRVAAGPLPMGRSAGRVPPDAPARPPRAGTGRPSSIASRARPVPGGPEPRGTTAVGRRPQALIARLAAAVPGGPLEPTMAAAGRPEPVRGASPAPGRPGAPAGAMLREDVRRRPAMSEGRGTAVVRVEPPVVAMPVDRRAVRSAGRGPAVVRVEPTPVAAGRPGPVKPASLVPVRPGAPAGVTSREGARRRRAVSASRGPVGVQERPGKTASPAQIGPGAQAGATPVGRRPAMDAGRGPAHAPGAHREPGRARTATGAARADRRTPPAAGSRGSVRSAAMRNANHCIPASLPSRTSPQRPSGST